MRKGVLVPVLVVVLLLLMAAGGFVFVKYAGSDPNSPDEGDEGGEQQETDDEMGLYYIASDDDLPDCDADSMNSLYYVESAAGFQTCTSTGWAFVDLAGQSESGGTNGSDGEAGQQGEPGEPGETGATGHSALATTEDEPPGSNCVNGGIKIEVGVDDNDNNLLDWNEVDQTQYVCNGSDGQDGQDGQNGTSGGASEDTMLTRISTPTLQSCSSGGRIMEQGLDNGDGGGIAQNSILEDGEIDYTTTYCSNYVVSRLADIYSGTADSLPGSTTSFVVVGNTLYFNARDATYGAELWAHDMTTGTTSIAVNIHAGFYSSLPGAYAGMVAIGTTLYFDAWTGTYGNELWAYETTNDTAWLVADINSGNYGSAIGYWGGIVAVGTTLYFDAFTNTGGHELWAHDTVDGSTWLVADINSGPDGSTPGYYTRIKAFGTTLYFSATDGTTGYELWAHDTVGGSTWQVSDINSGSDDSLPGRYSGLTLVGTTLYFDADDGNSGTELWAHDTQGSSVWQVYDINAGPLGSDPGENAGFTSVGSVIYFDASDSNAGRELWAHDATTGSTWRVVDIYGGSSGSYPGFRAGLAVVDSTLYFDAYTTTGGRELWAYETTTDSTWQVADINSTGSSGPGDLADLTVVGTRIYFDADDGINGRELWVLETTDDSTWQVADINASGHSDIAKHGSIVSFGSRLYFDATDGGSGCELWTLEIEHSITYN